MTIRYLVDTSVWSRVDRQPVIKQAVVNAVLRGQVVTCPPVLLELGFSARNLADWDALHHNMSSFPVLPMSATTHSIARDIQRGLWSGGKVRAAGAIDTLIAAIAIEHEATLMHYDRDFQHIAAVDHRLIHQWAVPAGTVS